MFEALDNITICHLKIGSFLAIKNQRILHSCGNLLKGSTWENPLLQIQNKGDCARKFISILSVVLFADEKLLNYM